MRIRKIITLLLAAVMVLSVLGAPALAEGEAKPVISYNIGANDYVNFNRWAENVRSYMFDSGSGTFTRVEYTEEEGVFVELYKDDVFQWRKEIALELPIWGGFFAGERFNFFVFGRENQSENDEAEVVRIVRYTKDWQRVDAVSVRGANTTIPFDAGSLRMVENGDTLYIHTCHLMYGHGDTRHQATLWFDLNAPVSGKMTMLRSGYEVSNNTHDYVSHSFNQFVVTDGEYVVKLDHGDAYPRSITLCRKPMDGAYVNRVTVMPISGEFGDNDTGVTLGGLEATDSSFIVAGSAVSMGEGYDPYGARNIFISVIEKQTLKVSSVFLTNYGAGGTSVSNPQLVKLNGDSLLLMWNEGSGQNYNKLRYMIIDGQGKVKSSLYSTEAYLSDCQPIVMNGKVSWYMTDGEKMSLYSIDVKTMGVTVKTLAEGGVKPIDDDPSVMRVDEDTEVTLSLKVSGGNPVYQWQYSADGGETWNSFPVYEQSGSTATPTGSETDTLVFTAKAQYNNNLFRCMIIMDGERMLFSTPVRLVIKLKNTPDPGPGIEERTTGDLNGDGSIDNVDLVTLARYLVGLDRLTDQQLRAADMSQDGMIDNKDLIMLARMLVTG